MHKLLYLLFPVLFLLPTENTLAQKTVVTAVIENQPNKPSSDTIFYNINQKLQWTDFQGKPGTQHFIGAITASGFAFRSSMNYSNDVLNIRINISPFFSKKDSWKKSEINSSYHLEHEQHHFDISRLGAEEFLKEIQKTTFTMQNYQQLLNKIFSRVYDANIELQQQYDRETKNSIDITKQMEWNKIINDKIESLVN